MSCIRNLIVACTLASAVFAAPAIKTTEAASLPPIINSSSANATQLTINGSGFLPGVASVLLGPYGPLTVVTQTATQLVVSLPAGIPAGSYALSVQITDKGKGASDESVAMIGGTPGPKGDTGSQGPPGPQGTAGPPLASLAGIPCDTGSLDKPDGRTTVAVAADSGVITLKCLSSSTNPTLTVLQGMGPVVCGSVIGITVCHFQIYGVQEVDGTGTPVANGFACDAAGIIVPPGGVPLFPIPIVCGPTQRFGPGTTVRLGTSTLTGVVPSWVDCDSTVGGICTVTMNAARQVAVTPVEP